MEILSANYHCRNPFVAGYLPILDVNREDPLKRPNKSKQKNMHILVTTSQTSVKLSACPSLGSQSTTIYQIDVSELCTPRIRQPNQLAEPNGHRPASGSNEAPSATARSKKALKNKRKKEAKRKRRTQRHVHFPEEEELIAIIFVVEDDDDIKESRNKYWEFFAIDRNRFQHRVQKLAKVLEKVLVPEHRAKIYKERFSSDEDDCSETGSERRIGIHFENNNPVESSSGESGFEHETESEYEVSDKEDEIILSITLSNCCNLNAGQRANTSALTS